MVPKIVCLVQLILFSFGDSESKSIQERGIDLSHLNTAAFALPSEKTGVLVTDWDENSDSNPEELGEYAEGDILFPNLVGRNGLKAESTRWPKAIIPYEIKGNFDAHEMKLIEQAINVYHNKTCLKFQPRMGEADYIKITSSSTGCWSSVGRIGGSQDVNLQTPGCLKRIGTVLHELMHAAGFLHEQNRHERDSYVEIVWKNIKHGHEQNFDKAKKSKTNDFGIVYDYNSIMHYSSKAFSTNGERTIIPKTMNMEIGQRKGFSRGDIQKINRMYNCTVSNAST